MQGYDQGVIDTPNPMSMWPMLHTHVTKAAVAPPSDEAATLRERGALVRLEHEL